ncbi:MAG TPA: IclR family transcriptional regulator, partial [Erwinia persicina]|nr:IclR family transcriptional regulator [Erwinia persicina]
MFESSGCRDDERSGGIQVITRAAKILDALGAKPDGMSLGEIAQAVDLPRSTVQRIVAALDSVQLVRSHGAAAGVRLGPALLRLIANVHTDVVAIAQPWLQALCDQTGETVSL